MKDFLILALVFQAWSHGYFCSTSSKADSIAAKDSVCSDPSHCFAYAKVKGRSCMPCAAYSRRRSVEPQCRRYWQ